VIVDKMGMNIEAAVPFTALLSLRELNVVVVAAERPGAAPSGRCFHRGVLPNNLVDTVVKLQRIPRRCNLRAPHADAVPARVGLAAPSRRCFH